jgi:hypothetical protein
MPRCVHKKRTFIYNEKGEVVWVCNDCGKEKVA